MKADGNSGSWFRRGSWDRDGMFLYATHPFRQLAAFIRAMRMRVCKLLVQGEVHTGVIAGCILCSPKFDSAT